MKMIKAFKEEINKFFKKIQETPIKQVKKINKTFQDPKNGNRSNEENTN